MFWCDGQAPESVLARYFDPQLGRFLTQDSFLGTQDNPPSLHRYLYGYANPLRYVDPTGHQSEALDPRLDPNHPQYDPKAAVMEDHLRYLAASEGGNGDEGSSGHEPLTVGETNQTSEAVEEGSWRGPGAGVLNWIERKAGEAFELIGRPFRAAGEAAAPAAEEWALENQNVYAPSERTITMRNLGVGGPSIGEGTREDFADIAREGGRHSAQEGLQLGMAGAIRRLAPGTRLNKSKSPPKRPARRGGSPGGGGSTRDGFARYVEAERRIDLTPSTLAELEDRIRLNAGIADDATRAARVPRTRGRFGTRAHTRFESLNQELNRELQKANSPYQVVVEEFRDSAGGVVRRRAPGSRGVDTVIYKNGVPVGGFDLKTGRPWSAAKLREAQKRFGVDLTQVESR